VEFPGDENVNNDTFYIVGGGPSLKKGFNWNRLKGKRTIVINRAHEDVPWAEILFFADNRFFENQRDKILQFPGRIIAGTLKPVDHPRVEHYKVSGIPGIELRNGYLRSGNNSGYATINLAILLGARKIYLLGIDMKFGENGETHYHDGHHTKEGNLIANFERQFDKMIPFFSDLPPILKRLGVEVYNVNPDSELTVFPKLTFEGANL
jgi:hypothetical protein